VRGGERETNSDPGGRGGFLGKRIGGPKYTGSRQMGIYSREKGGGGKSTQESSLLGEGGNLNRN